MSCSSKSVSLSCKFHSILHLIYLKGNKQHSLTIQLSPLRVLYICLELEQPGRTIVCLFQPRKEQIQTIDRRYHPGPTQRKHRRWSTVQANCLELLQTKYHEQNIVRLLHPRSTQKQLWLNHFIWSLVCLSSLS